MKLSRWSPLFAASVVVALLFACGGAPPAQTPENPPPAASASASASPTASASSAPAPVSVVKFDDLGVSFAVPPGYKVLGDDDLAARIRASGSARLTSALESRASQKKGLPLLSLQKETTEKNDGLNVTISVTVVPVDATAAELLAQQRAVMTENLEAFSITSGPTDHAADGVLGSELSDKYVLRAGGEPRRMASVMRMHVRKGRAFLAVAVFPETSGRDEEARLVLDGLHFYEPAP